jgi:hypothetical protein
VDLECILKFAELRTSGSLSRHTQAVMLPCQACTLNRKLSEVSVARATNAQVAVNKHEAQVTEKFAYSPVEYMTELGFSAASSRDH